MNVTYPYPRPALTADVVVTCSRDPQSEPLVLLIRLDGLPQCRG